MCVVLCSTSPTASPKIAHSRALQLVPSESASIVKQSQSNSCIRVLYMECAPNLVCFERKCLLRFCSESQVRLPMVFIVFVLIAVVVVVIVVAAVAVVVVIIIIGRRCCCCFFFVPQLNTGFAAIPHLCAIWMDARYIIFGYVVLLFATNFIECTNIWSFRVLILMPLFNCL